MTVTPVYQEKVLGIQGAAESNTPLGSDLHGADETEVAENTGSALVRMGQQDRPEATAWAKLTRMQKGLCGKRLNQ